MNGHLHLVCARRSCGANHLREQSFRAPLHLSKPHEDAGALVVNLASPTAGIFDDDLVALNVVVEKGANLTLTTPAATRIYRSRNGGAARIEQTFTVHEDATFEYFPEPLIPHAGAKISQRTTLHAAEGSTAMLFEWLSPGRAARGECFVFSEINWETDFYCVGSLAARERFALRPDDDSLTALREFSPEAHYLGCFVCGVEVDPEMIESVGNEDVYAGCSPLPHGATVIKAMCRDSLTARRTLQSLRAALHKMRGTSAPWTGRF